MNKIYGCSKPFQIILLKNGLFEINICNYI